MAETEETVEGMRTPKCASSPNFSSLFEWFSHHVFLNSFANSGTKEKQQFSIGSMRLVYIYLTLP